MQYFYTHTHSPTHTHTQSLTHTHTHPHIHIHIHTHTHTHTLTHSHTHRQSTLNKLEIGFLIIKIYLSFIQFNRFIGLVQHRGLSGDLVGA